jgi:3-methyladenine DNA glycosylase AlkD
MDIAGEIESLLWQIKQNVDPDPRYHQGMRRAVPTEHTLYGVRVPRLRKIAQEWQRSHQKATPDELLALVDALWGRDSREERLMAIYLLTRFKRLIPALEWAHFDRWRQRIDNWEESDGLAQWVLAPWILDDPGARLSHLQDIVGDESVWSRRLALVATVPINRGRTGLTIADLTLEMIDRVKEEREVMVTKAVSWALRGMAKNHPKRTAAYLEDNRHVLHPHVVREVESKLRTGLKSGIPKA